MRLLSVLKYNQEKNAEKIKSVHQMSKTVKSQEVNLNIYNIKRHHFMQNEE